MERLESFRKRMEQEDLQAFVVTNIHNVRYLSGFTGSRGALYVNRATAYLITDFCYEEQAKGEVGGGIEVRVDKRDPLAVLCELVTGEPGRIGFESGTLPYASFEKLQAEAGDRLVGVEGAIEDLRATKDQGEIERIARAVKIADEVFERIVKEIRPGMSEIEVAARIDYLVRMASGEITPFKTIVASGARASLPHAAPTTRRIGEGDLVKMDFGASYEGYCSDLTRTVVVGKPDEKQAQIHRIVLEAQQKAISGIKAGIKASEADSLARSHIEEAGYGEQFGHSLGHGLGLEVHEQPRLSQKNEQVLKAGMVVTVEPGIYIPGWGGVRIEDVVVVEEGGCRVLSNARRQLITVGGNDGNNQ